MMLEGSWVSFTFGVESCDGRDPCCPHLHMNEQENRNPGGGGRENPPLTVNGKCDRPRQIVVLDSLSPGFDFLFHVVEPIQSRAYIQFSHHCTVGQPLN